MTTQEWTWLIDGKMDRTQKPGGGGFTYGEWSRAHEEHAKKMRAKNG